MADRSRHVVALVKDLFFGVKIENATRHLQKAGEQITVEFARNGNDLVARVGQTQATLVILDLSLTNVDLTQVVPAMRNAAGDAPLTVLAFGPHTDKTGRAAARAAGCDVVVANSRFDRELAPLLQRFSAPAATNGEMLALDDEEADHHT